VSTKLVMDTSPGGRRSHRAWPEALKREIVAATRAPGASVAKVARQYEVNANQLFQWRKLYRDGPAAVEQKTAARLIPVVVTAEQNSAAVSPAHFADTIEIDLPGKYRVRVGGDFDGPALLRVLDVLERR